MADKKPKTPKKKNADHPLYIDMIVAAITALKERKGSSRVAIVKYIQANYKVGDNVNQCVKMTLKRNVLSGKLKQVTGVGSNGSFKVSEAAKAKSAAKPKVAKKKAATPKKKPAAKKAKKPAKKTPKKKATGKPKAKVAASKSKKPTPKKAAPKKKATPKKKPAAKKGKGKKK